MTTTFDIIIPHVGETTTTVRVSRWLKSEGQAVRKGEPMLEIDTDKSTIEIEALADGVLERIVVPEGSEADAMQVVGQIRAGAPAVAIATPEAQPPSRTKGENPNGQVNATPLAMKLADELGVSLAAVHGSGPKGRITQYDVQHFAEARKRAAPQPDGAGDAPAHGPSAQHAAKAGNTPATPKAKRLAKELGVDVAALSSTRADGLVSADDVLRAALAKPAAIAQPAPPEQKTAVREFSRARKTIAARTLASKRDVPHFYLQVEADMTECEKLRAYCADVLKWERKPTINDVIVRATAVALRAMPQLNASVSGEGYVGREQVNIGIAVSREDGLLVPVLQNADGLDLRATSQQARELADRARAGKLRAGDSGEKSITISNLGMYGIDAFFAIIDMPDPMILAVGQVKDRVVPIAGRAEIRPMCMLTLSADHRILDGALAAQFLSRVRAAIEQPYELLR